MADNLTKAQRRRCMSRVKNKDTDIERRVRSNLHKNGYRFRKNYKLLPGKPDVAFTRAKVAVFIDGDFWHGYRFSEWRETLSDFWKKKISINIERDEKNFKALESQGWTVIRIWQHEIKEDLEACIRKITAAVDSRQP